MIKFLLILIPGIIAYILCRIKKEYRTYITAAFLLYVVVVSIFYNQRVIPRLMTFVRPTNQIIYQESYAESRELPDAFIQLVIDGKTIYTKNDPWTLEDAQEAGFDWLYSYYHMKNPVLYSEHYGATVIPDELLNNTVINEEELVDFTDIGYANDMLRNVCMYYPDIYLPATNFCHYSYYGNHLEGMHIYVNLDGLYDTDELVLIWQTVEPGTEQEDLYLMTKDYYDTNIAANN